MPSPLSPSKFFSETMYLCTNLLLNVRETKKDRRIEDICTFIRTFSRDVFDQSLSFGQLHFIRSSGQWITTLLAIYSNYSGLWSIIILTDPAIFGGYYIFGEKGKRSNTKSKNRSTTWHYGLRMWTENNNNKTKRLNLLLLVIRRLRRIG